MNTLKLSIITCFSILYSLTSFAEVKSDVSIEIGSFDSIPSEIDGGCCVFYKYPGKVRNKGYIMVNDLATTVYMMVNRHLEEFTLVANKKDVFWYKNKKFTIKVTINSTTSKGHGESFNVKGILIVEDHNKNRRKLAFCWNCDW
ncbi:hypothetical protein ACQRD6_12725 [Prevotella sp. SGI.027]